MSRDAQGNFNLPSPLNPVQTGTVIESEWANTTLDDVAAGLTDSLSRTGKGGMSAPLAMGGNRIVALAPASQFSDAPQAIQVRDTAFNRLSNVASDSNGNVYTATSLITTPPVDGTLFLFVADKDNSGSMTLAVNAGAALPITVNGITTPPKIVVAGAVIGVMFLNGGWRITNTAGSTGTINQVQSDNVDAISVTNNTNLAVATLNIHPNVPRGLAQLDSNAKLPVAQMPFSTLSFIGNWNATSGALPPPAENGQVYLIVAAGTLSLYRPDAPNSNHYTQQATPVAVNDQILYRKGTTDPVNQPDGWYYSPAPSGTATAANVSMLQTSGTPPFGGITNVQSWLNAADPQIRGKLNLAGGTLTGDVIQTAARAGPTSLATVGDVSTAFSSIPPNVSSFTGDPSAGQRTGPVALSANDVKAVLTYTPANVAGQAFTGPVSAPAFNSTGFYTGKGYSQITAAAAPIAGTVFDYNNGQSQIITLTAPVTITAVNNIPVGSILRLTLWAANNVVTWPASIHWPLGATPDLTLGPLKKAVIVIENDGAVLLATSAAF